MTAKSFRSSIAVLAGVFLVTFPATARDVDSGLVTLHDAEIEYVARGEGEAIVLLPGGTLTVDHLNGLSDALARSGYRVVGINFPGSGRSTGPNKGVTLETLADQVAEVIRSLDIGPVHLAGNDFGNRVARMLAASNPDLVKSVILLAAGGKFPPKPAAENALLVLFDRKRLANPVFRPAPTRATILRKEGIARWRASVRAR